MSYIHSTPGRLRIKSPAVKKNSATAKELRKTLSTVFGIATVDINPTTGSVLVNYNPKAIALDDILALLERRGYFEPTKAEVAQPDVRSAVVTSAKVIAKSLIGEVLQGVVGVPALSLVLSIIL
jgi:copper chaperone CopZ